MTLRDLIGEGAPEVPIAGLAYSSGSVEPGFVFFCVRGFKADGHDYAPDAVARGAQRGVARRRGSGGAAGGKRRGRMSLDQAVHAAR